MKLSWHLHVMSDCFGRICHDFSFSSQAAKLSLKAALATCLSIYLALLLNFQDPFFAGFGCFLMLLPSSASVLERAYQSVLGALFGGVSGYVLLGLLINDHFAFTLVIFAIISVFSYMMSAKKNSFFWYYALVNLLLAAISGAVNPSTSLDIMFFRITNVALGIFCYVFVAVIVFPDFTEKSFRKKFKTVHMKVYRCVADVLKQYISGNYAEKSTFSIMDTICKDCAEIEDMMAELKKEERIFGISNMDYEILLLDLKRISTDLREFYEYASSGENRKCTFQKIFTHRIQNVILMSESASDFNYNQRHPYSKKLLSLLQGFDSGREKRIYLERKDEFRPEDVLIFLECLKLCKSLVPMEHFNALVKKGDAETSPGKDTDLDDDRLDIALFGRKLFSIDLLFAKFAMKSGLAVIADFWLYFWFEIPGSPTTVAISAITVTRPDIVTTRHRSILRIAGCLAGVLCSFVFLAFGIQTTLIMFTCLFIMTFISGLIWIGDTGISYFGYQMLIAYMFSIIPNSMPALDVTEATQRIVAITIGVMVAWIVMTFVFPENLQKDFFSRFRKRRKYLKGNLLSIASHYSAQGENAKSVSANFAIGDYNSLLSLLMTIKEHREIDADDMESIRLFIMESIRIHRELEGMSKASREIMGYLLSVDPHIGKNILCLASDAICLENGMNEDELKTRADQLSCNISDFENKQRVNELLTRKSMDFKTEAAHALLSIRRMLEYTRSVITLREKIHLP